MDSMVSDFLSWTHHLYNQIRPRRMLQPTKHTQAEYYFVSNNSKLFLNNLHLNVDEWNNQIRWCLFLLQCDKRNRWQVFPFSTNQKKLLFVFFLKRLFLSG